MSTKLLSCVCGEPDYVRGTEWLVDGVNIVECRCGIRRVLWAGDSITTSGLSQITPHTETYTDSYKSGNYHSTDRIEDTGHPAHTERIKHDYQVAKLRLGQLNKVAIHRTDFKGYNVKLLDVGCSNGAFVMAAIDNHFDAYGCDLSTNAVAETIDKYRIRTGGINSCGWQRRSFDVVTFNDVLEHIPDPISALKTARGILKRTGILAVDIPNMGCAEAIEQQHTFKHVKPHEHLWYWNANHLRTLLESCGFNVVKMEVPIPGKVTAYACPDASVEEIEILGPPGIGDIIWTLPKLKGIRERENPCRIKYVVCVADQTKLGTRAKDFMLLCPLIDSVEFRDVPLPRDVGNDNPAIPRYELIANEWLEPQNKWLEDWRSELYTDWDINIQVPECAIQQVQMRLAGLTDFAVFYISSNIWNEVVCKPDWTPTHYAETFIRLKDSGITPVIIGAEWDKSYALEVAIEMTAMGREPSSVWINTIGRTPIALAMAYMKLAKVTVGIANGLPMVATYMNRPSIIIWPQKGISHTKVEWGKNFQTNWMSPEIRESGKYKAMVIGDFTPADLVAAVLNKC